MSRACCVYHIVRPNGDSKEVVARWVCGQEEEESVEVEMEDETENGSRTVKKVQDPRDPSKEERAQHEMTHLPYRSWCRHCVRGRGKTDAAPRRFSRNEHKRGAHGLRVLGSRR